MVAFSIAAGAMRTALALIGSVVVRDAYAQTPQARGYERSRAPHDGARSGPPVTADRCSFFVGRSYRAGDVMRGAPFVISHLEFVTLSGLKELVINMVPTSPWFAGVKMRAQSRP